MSITLTLLRLGVNGAVEHFQPYLFIVETSPNQYAKIENARLRIDLSTKKLIVLYADLPLAIVDYCPDPALSGPGKRRETHDWGTNSWFRLLYALGWFHAAFFVLISWWLSIVITMNLLKNINKLVFFLQ